MGQVKKNFYLQLHKKFFDDVAIQTMKRINPLFVLVYQEMLLYVADKDFIFSFKGLQPSIDKEMALAIGETPATCGKVLKFLEKSGKVERISEDQLFFPESLEITGKITDSAIRMRAWRERHNVTESDTESESETEQQTDITNHILQTETESEGGRSFSEAELMNICREKYIRLSATDIATFAYKLGGLHWKLNGQEIYNIIGVLKEYEKDRKYLDQFYSF